MDKEISKTFVRSDGAICDVQAVRELLMAYWDLSEEERKTFDIVKENKCVEKLYLEEKWKKQ